MYKIYKKNMYFMTEKNNNRRTKQNCVSWDGFGFRFYNFVSYMIYVRDRKKTHRKTHFEYDSFCQKETVKRQGHEGEERGKNIYF